MEERNERGPPPPQIDPKWSQDAQSTKTGDPRLDFYALYRKVTTKYDEDFVKRYHEELNAILIFAGLLSAVCSAFAVDLRSNISGSNAPLDEGYFSSISHLSAGLIYASLLTSICTASIAVSAKRWFVYYLEDKAGPLFERCRDRQRRCDKFEGRMFIYAICSLPVLLHYSLLFLGWGVYFYVLPASSVLGVVLGIGFLVPLPFVGVLNSVAGPPQTWWLGNPLAFLWKLLSQILKIFYRPRALSLPTTRLPPQEPAPRLGPLRSLWENIRSKITHLTPHSSQSIPLSTIQDAPPSPPVTSHWPVSTAMREANADDLRCVSWILRKIPNQEAFCTAALHASTIRWLEGGFEVITPFDLLVSNLKGCFSSTGKIYPGMRDGAYCSLRAIIWIHIRATRVSGKLARQFPLPDIHYNTTSLDPDLKDLLGILGCRDTRDILPRLYFPVPGSTPAHLRWTSRALLHLSLTRWGGPGKFGAICDYRDKGDQNVFPPDAILDRLLASCIFLGHPIEKEVLEVEDKSDDVEKILSRLSQAIVPAISASHPQRKHLPYVLHDLIGWKARPNCLTEMVYEWCSAVREKYPNLADGQDLLLLFLQIGFRHLDPQCDWIEAKPDHTNHHQQMAIIVLASGDSEAIGDLLQAWMPGDESHQLYTSLGMCAEPLVGLRRLRPFSSRLRQLVMRAVGLIGYREFEQVGVEGFVELLNDLHVSVKDTIDRAKWTQLLLDTVQSSEGIQHLPYSYWELLAELAFLGPWGLQYGAYSPDSTTYLKDTKKWEKLGCWVGVVWMAWPPEDDMPTEGDLEDAMLLLFCKLPDAIQKLEQWMERRRNRSQDTPGSFQRICEQTRRELTRQNAL